MPSRTPSRSPSRGRSRTRSARLASQPRSHSPRRSISPRSASRSRSEHRSPSPRGGRADVRNGHAGNGTKSISKSVHKSRSPGGRRPRSPNRSPVRPPRSSKIVVEKLTKNVNENHLHEIFGMYGAVREVDMPMNRQCRYCRGSIAWTTSDFL